MSTSDLPHIVGEYRLQRCIGSDSSGTVYLAATAEGRHVALTTLHSRMATNQVSLIRFYQQARLAIRLRHPNLIRGLEIGQDCGMHYFVREFVPVQSLHYRLSQFGPFDEGDAIEVIGEVASAVEALHNAGVVHCGLSSRVALVGEDGCVKVGGLSSSQLTRGKQQLPPSPPSPQGLFYRPPEQIRDTTNISLSTDTYALGALLYEMLTGAAPFADPSETDLLARKFRNDFVPVEQLVPAVSPHLAETIRGCLSASPHQRPADVAEFREMLSPQPVPVAATGEIPETADYCESAPATNSSSARTGAGSRRTTAQNRNVLLTPLPLKKTIDDAQWHRCYEDARRAMKIDHPNVAGVKAIREEYGRRFLVTEYVEGTYLTQRIKNRGPLEEEEALQIALDVARGLNRIHLHNLLHRDVKPGNIVITPDGTVKLINLGLAHPVSGSLSLAVEGNGFGTPQYMAPEQFCDTMQVDARADLYSLGVTLYVMLTGEVPFLDRSNFDKLNAKAENDYIPVEAFAPWVSAATCRLVRHAMQPDPRQRPANARQFMQALVHCLAADKTPAIFGVDEQKSSPDSHWHVVYKNPLGRKQLVRGPFVQVANWLRTGKVPHDAVARFGRQGEFRALCEIKHFEGILREVEPACDATAASAAVETAVNMSEQTIATVRRPGRVRQALCAMCELLASAFAALRDRLTAPILPLEPHAAAIDEIDLPAAKLHDTQLLLP